MIAQNAVNDLATERAEIHYYCIRQIRGSDRDGHSSRVSAARAHERDDLGSVCSCLPCSSAVSLSR